MDRSMRWLVLALAALGLSACVTATPYEARRGQYGYGYFVQQIEQNRVRVSFRGNSNTEREAVENALLYRAAETTIERGMDYFVIGERGTDARSRLQPTGVHRYPFDYWYYHPRWGWRAWYDPFWDDVDYRQVTQYEASAEITMHAGLKPAENPNAFNAREVIENIGPTLVRRAPAS